jgi:hypothetical protein
VQPIARVNVAGTHGGFVLRPNFIGREPDFPTSVDTALLGGFDSLNLPLTDPSSLELSDAGHDHQP